MVGWNARPQHVMNLQRANEWIYSYPTVSELITAATAGLEVRRGERCPERKAAGGTSGTGHRGGSAWLWLCQPCHLEPWQAPGLPHLLQRSCQAAVSGSWFGLGEAGEAGKGARFPADFTLANAALPQGTSFCPLPTCPDGTRSPMCEGIHQQGCSCCSSRLPLGDHSHG